jgi:uncharacterized BrkB/YihY/UPF0761 family membrane protein
LTTNGFSGSEPSAGAHAGLLGYDGGMEHIRRIFRFAAIALYFVLVYTVVIVATPLAIIVLAIAFLIDWLKLRDEEKTVSMVWIIVIGASGMVINLLCIPFGLLWYWLRGKPMPHPLD